MTMCGRCWTEVPLRYFALLESLSTSALNGEEGACHAKDFEEARPRR